MKDDSRAYFTPDTFLSRHTDGPECPLARVYSRAEASALFRAFSEVRFVVHFWNRRWIPIVGNVLPARLESSLTSRWGWHLWIYATTPLVSHVVKSDWWDPAGKKHKRRALVTALRAHG